MALKYSNKYDDIINVEYCKSKKFAHMGMVERAAQFSSFDALSGLDESMKETYLEEINIIKEAERGFSAEELGINIC